MTPFGLIMTVILTTGEPVDIVTGIYDSEKECMAAANEQKISGECLPVEKVIHTGLAEIPASK